VLLEDAKTSFERIKQRELDRQFGDLPVGLRKMRQTQPLRLA